MVTHADALSSAIVYDRDYMYDYFGFKTLERSYLLRLEGKIAERPQHMLMRVSAGIHCGDIEATLETYNLLSNGWFTHASPTLFNAGTPRPQLSSCFVAGTKISTVNRGAVNIEDARLGDLVRTHRGNIKPVVQVHKNKLGERKLYDLKCWDTPSITVTDNHRVMATSKSSNWKAAWTAVDALTPSHYVMRVRDGRLAKKHSPTTGQVVVGDNVFLKVRAVVVSTSARPEYVYTLGVRDDHSYNVEGLVVENCFLLTMADDSIEGIYDTLKQTAVISKSAGGIGLAVHNIRATGSYIRGTNGQSNGLVPMLRVYNNVSPFTPPPPRLRPHSLLTHSIS